MRSKLIPNVEARETFLPLVWKEQIVRNLMKSSIKVNVKVSKGYLSWTPSNTSEQHWACEYLRKS